VSGTLCLGEPSVDLIVEGSGDPVAHLGGATANVAVAAARAGGRVTFAGGAGEDRWGHWARDRLAAEGVGLERFRLLPGRGTQLAQVAIDELGEPTYDLGEIVTGGLAAALGDDPAAALAGAGGLCISSLTLATADERALTMSLRERALAGSPPRPVILDVSLRRARWSSRADAAASVNACVPGAVLVRAGRADAALLTGEDDPERAALALRKAGARVVVITLGSAGAIARGERRLRRDAPARPTRVLSTVGAAEALTGTLLAALERSGYYADAAVAALDDGLAAAARACARWGAND
jgi:sugar/nucleoside kinase (ribokinase family)